MLQPYFGVDFEFLYWSWSIFNAFVKLQRITEESRGYLHDLRLGDGREMLTFMMAMSRSKPLTHTTLSFRELKNRQRSLHSHFYKYCLRPSFHFVLFRRSPLLRTLKFSRYYRYICDLWGIVTYFLRLHFHFLNTRLGYQWTGVLKIILFFRKLIVSFDNPNKIYQRKSQDFPVISVYFELFDICQI